MNIVALMIGKKSSSGVPNKNISMVLGHRLCEYPLMAASASKYVKKIFVSTDSPVIAEVGRTYGAEIIDRPKSLEDPETLTENVLSHAHEVITKEREVHVDYYVLLYSNGGFINTELLNDAIEKLIANPTFDSCVGAVSADMFTPIRAKKINADGELVPFADLDTFGDMTSNRDSAGSAYFIDLSLQVIKPECFARMDGSQRPFLWLGKKILPYEKPFGGDLDATWQYPVLESWLKENLPDSTKS
jgi:CMP-N-acetylneuraminic acid synthetase